MLLLFDSHLVMGRQVGARGLSHTPQEVRMGVASSAEQWRDFCFLDCS